MTAMEVQHPKLLIATGYNAEQCVTDINSELRYSNVTLVTSTQFTRLDSGEFILIVSVLTPEEY